MWYQTQYAYTLIELLVTITIIVIGGMFAIPLMQTWIDQNRLQSAIHQWLASVAQAREEAILRNETVRLCPSHDGQSCSTTYDQGWIIITEEGHVIKDIVVPKQISIQNNGLSAVMYFLPMGIATGSMFTLKFGNDKQTYCLMVSRTGRLRHRDC
jgi:type IV fimbrial biogenesis protein FimT